MSAACCSRGRRRAKERKKRNNREFDVASSFSFFLSLARERPCGPCSSFPPKSSRGRSALAPGTDKNRVARLTGTCRSARGSPAEWARSCRARRGPASPRRRTRPRLPSKELRCVRRSPWLLKLFGKEGKRRMRERSCVCECCCKGREEKKGERAAKRD